MNVRKNAPSDALTLGLSREDFAELIVGGFDAWCAVLRGSSAQQQEGGTRPHRWDALSNEDGAEDARRVNVGNLMRIEHEERA